MSNFYLSKRWRDKREHILKRDGYQDQLEKRAGKSVPAVMVHHIFPREQYPQYALSDWNLISLSIETHNSLHLFNGNLSPLGEKLKKETAEKNDIRYYERILVIGLPGSGKSTWARKNLGDGLAYDLDLIAEAFRMGKTGEHKGARRMANSMVRAFAVKAERYTNKIILIRTAPSLEEIVDLDIDRLVVCKGGSKGKTEIEDAEEKIKAAIEWAKANGIEVAEAAQV